MKTAIYVRVSTREQEEENQLLQLRDYCNNAKHDITGEYVDVITGKEEHRPGFDRLFNDAHQLKFQHLVFWDISRFSRAGIEHTFRKLKELNNLGITWHSYSEPLVNTDNELARDIVIAVFAAVAKAERQKISDRTKAGLERLKRQGIKLGRPNGAKDKKQRRTLGYYKK
jgi:DNA invertase Pin-like site-specific DNA recombinase